MTLSTPLTHIEPATLGSWLRLARKARRLTQQSAADHIGVARTTVTAIEKGERRVTPDDLARLAALYGRSINELLRPSGPAVGLGAQLRSAAGSDVPETEVAESLAEFERLCEDYLELERLTGAPLPRHYPAIYAIDEAPLESAADDVATAERNRLGLGDGPLLHLRGPLEGDVGLRVFYMPLPSKVAAMFAYTESTGGCIAVNRKHPEERRRMSIAHDYAHFLTNRFRPEITLAGRGRRQPEQERFAEAFARAFLMPASGLSRRFHELRRSRAGKVTPADLCVMAHMYHVSLEAFTLRLEDLRLIGSGTWERLRQAGFRVREAQALLNLEPHPTADSLLPVRYHYLAVLAFERGDLSEGQLARFLRVDRVEARRIVDDLGHSVTVGDDGAIESLSLNLDEVLPSRGGSFITGLCDDRV